MSSLQSSTDNNVKPEAEIANTEVTSTTRVITDTHSDVDITVSFDRKESLLDDATWKKSLDVIHLLCFFTLNKKIT